MSLFGFGKKKVETPASSAKATQRAKRSEEFEQRKAQNKAQVTSFSKWKTNFRKNNQYLILLSHTARYVHGSRR